MRAGEPLPLLGRSGELATLIEGIDEVARGAGRSVLLEGEAGIGKTRLLDELVDAASARDFHVVRAEAHELEQELPFAPLVEGLHLRPDAQDERRAAVGRLLGGLTSPAEPQGDAAQRRLQVVQAAVDLVEDLSTERPVLLALEDAHWADPPTLTVMARLARRIRRLPLLLVVTARPYPRSAELSALLETFGKAGSLHVSLGPLPEEAVEALASAVVGATPGPNLRVELADVAGNPLYITELLAALGQDGAFTVADGHAELAEARVPPSLRLTVLRRLGVLPDDTIELLRLAAILGAAFDAETLGLMADRPELDVIRDLEPARRAGFVGAVEDRLVFRHDLVREAVYEDLPEAVRRPLHGRAARLFDAAGRSGGQLAPHLLRGTLPADTATIAVLQRVANELRPLAPSVAVQLLERALTLGPSDFPGRDSVRADLVLALTWAQRHREAAAHADELLEELEVGRPRRTALLVRALTARLLGGVEGFPERLEAAATEPDVTKEEQGRLLAAAVAGWTVRDDYERAVAVGQTAMAAAERAGDDLALCATLVTLAVARQQHDVDDRAAMTLARRAVEVARRSEDPELHRALAPEATLAYIIGNAPEHRDEAVELLQEALMRAERQGHTTFEALYREALGVNLYRAGRWEEAAAELETAIVRAGELDLELGAQPYCRLARIAVHQGDLDSAASLVAQALATDEAQGFAHTPHVAIARAELLAARDDAEGALHVLRACYEAAPTQARASAAAVLRSTAVRLALQTGRSDLAREALGEGTDVHDPATTWLTAIVEDDLDALLAELERVRRSGAPLAEHLPLMCEDAADLLLDRSRPEEAAALLDEARQAWDAMPADREVRRIEARLRELGVRLGARGRRERPATGWEALTEAERRVVDLVAEGLTYREVGERLFISRRTVETHVAHVFPKLGVANRAELEAACAARRAAGASQAREGSVRYP